MPSTELSNVEFHCGRAEDLVPTLVSRMVSQKLVAILDPPRAGLREWPPFGGGMEKRAVTSGWYTRLCSFRPDIPTHWAPVPSLRCRPLGTLP